MMTTVSAVSTVGEKLNNLIVAEGVFHDEVVQLRSDLDLIGNCLVSNESDAVLKQVRQLAYEIEDAVECYSAAGQAAAAESKGAFWCRLWKRSTARSPRKDLSALQMRIHEVKNILTIRSSGGGGGGGGGGHHQRRVPDYRAPSTVPMMDQVSHLKYVWFERQGSQLSVTSLMGMPGLGKTALARLCYNDPTVTEYFDIGAWAYVGQKFQARDILENILFSLASDLSRDEISGMETIELINQLHKAQKEKIYLIVLDDIRSVDDWNTLRFAFRDDGNGSRILLTTREREFVKITRSIDIPVRFMTHDETYHFFKLKSGGLLDDDPGQVNPEMKVIAMRIAKFCDGFPIATAIIGGAMRTKNLEEWEGMEQMLRDNAFSSGDRMQRILAIGYNQLPLHLKPCFLYLGYFPPSQPIPVEKLCLLWIAEGFISIRGSNVGKSQMEVAEEYFDELFDRNMVSVAVNEEVPPSARFQSCTLNDSIRDLCIQKGGEEEFFKVARGNITRNLTGRVALCLNTDDIFPLNVSEGNDIRSILFYDMDESHSKQTRPGEFPDLTEFRRTRVLDFDEVDFRVKKLPRGVEKLTYLRHLSFRGCYLHEFTSSLSNFPLLETLDLRVRVSCVMTIQNVLTKLSSLKHLYFPLNFRCDGTEDKLKLDTLTKLQVLENFNACMCDVNDLLQMESLRVLTVYVDGNNTDLKKTTSCLNKNKFLRHSSVVVKNFDSYTKERLSVVAALLECNSLHGLDIEGYLGVTLLHGGIGSNFTSMVFNGSEFSEDPMPILGKLRNLRSLVLRNDAFVATKMVCSDESGFPQLTNLEISTLRLLEKWEVRGEVFMPKLAVLTIEKCDKLEEIPLGLRKYQLFEKSSLYRCPKNSRIS